MRPRIALASRDASKSDTECVALLKLSRNPAVRSFEFDQFAVLQICQGSPYIRGERFGVGFIFFG